jgi:hypothetical protein
MAGEELHQRQTQRRHAADEILARLRLMELWEEVGCQPKLVGAAAYGLMVATDVDLEIYSGAPSVELGFAVVSQLAREPGVWKVRFSNELDEPDQGLYWQVRYRLTPDEVWNVDMWLLPHDHPGPRSLDLVEPLTRALTEETTEAILRIKEILSEQPDAQSIEIYEAVIDGGVRSESEFREWQNVRVRTGLTLWRPTPND